MLVRQATGVALADDQTLAGAGLVDDDLVVLRPAQPVDGLGDGLTIAGLAYGAKVAVEAARVGVEAYRARTDRMEAELEREKFEAETARNPEAPTDPPEDHTDGAH
jgi:hypothetical protein